MISVLTVVRNGALTIGETIASVAAQNYEHIQHVIQDGASTDATADAVKRAASARVSFESQRDSGIYEGFNNAIARATGDVVGFLNCGDVFVSDEVVARIAACFSESSVDAVFGDVAYVRAKQSGPIVRAYSSEFFRPALLARGFIPAHPTLYVRRRLFDVVGLYDPSYRIAGDFDWIARMFALAEPRYLYIPKTLVRMRLGGASTAGLGATIRVTKEIRRACIANNIRTSYLRLLSRFPPKLLERVRAPR